MMFDEWWKQYLDNGGVTHFDLIANKESALAAWEAACEACAKICDEEASCEGIAQKCAEKIRGIMK